MSRNFLISLLKVLRTVIDQVLLYEGASEDDNAAADKVVAAIREHADAQQSPDQGAPKGE